MQKVSLKIALVAAALMLGLGGMAAAHHSGAAYDKEHPRTMEGTVKTVNWTNPHITFVVEADAKDGQPAATWVFEVSSPGVLTRSGWTKRSLQPGDHAVFFYAPLRDGNPGGFLLKVTLPNGQELSFSLTPADQ
jgi:Cu/Ag efflux protein CusF